MRLSETVDSPDHPGCTVTRISFGIYADFVNLRKETRLNSLVRPIISLEDLRSSQISKSYHASSNHNINIGNTAD